jgi:hypothetical protein
MPQITYPTGRFASREGFLQTVRGAFECAALEGWHEIIISDATFSDWPLNERAVVESLNAWSRTGRHFVMLATRFDEVQRLQARFVTWRQTWGHLIECHQCRHADATDLPSAIWSPHWMMHRIDPERCVYVCDDQAMRRVNLRQELDEWIRNSSPGFPASTLGL